ncbi:MAG: zinc ribbon domain-containing protein [Chloroflexota bacterium]|nr:zinc ribbon domain-containing protein [Chloroflexota bacterium]
MPIYEYTCGSCKRRVSLFFPNFSAADSRTAAGEIACPRCSSADLQRVQSRANTLRAEAPGGDTLDDTPDGLMSGLDEDDPRSVARWARRMKDSMGEDLDMGPGFDQVLSRIEAGEDPDKVMEDMDPELLGEAGDEGMGGDDLGGLDDL